MTDLSPEAQAVLDAYINAPCGKPRRPWVAAALRAAADQVVPPALEEEFIDRNQALPLTKMVEIRRKLLAIAAELDLQSPATRRAIVRAAAEIGRSMA